MFKANTGYSTGASAFDAGKEAAAQAVEGLDALMAAAALNANHNLMVTRLCTLLRRQAGR